MGLLKSVDNVPGIDYYEYREYHYWDKFKYRARLFIPGAHYTYWASNIDEWVSRVSRGNSWRGVKKLEKDKILQHTAIAEKFIDFKNQVKKNKDKKFCIRIEGDTTAIFSNDLNALQDLKSWGTQIDFTEVVCSEYKGVKHFVNQPKHKYRVYLKSKRVDSTLQSDLRDLLKTQSSLHPSAGLTIWLTRTTNWKSCWLSSAYFIDYDDESTLSYLAIMHGDILGRKYKLEKRPDTE